MDYSDPHTTLLLQRWQAGEEKALASLLEKHLDFIHAKVRQRMTPVLRSKMQSTDGVQETLLAFLQNAERYVIPNGRSFRGLMAAIAANLMLEEERWWSAKRRSISRERPLPTGTALNLAAPNKTPATIASDNEDLHWNLAGLDLMPPHDRKVIVLRIYDDMGLAEIAKTMDKTYDAVRMQFKRAVKTLGGIVDKLRRGELDQVLDDMGFLQVPDGDQED